MAEPYGRWPSPISPRDLAALYRFNDVQWDADGQTLVWDESRGGRSLLVAQRQGDAPRDLFRNRALRPGVGYGGSAFGVGREQIAFVTEQRLFLQPLSTGKPRPLTPAFGHAAAPVFSPDGAWLVFVHTYEDHDALAAVPTQGEGWPQRIAYGADFYMQPAFSPDGRYLAWVEWDFPNMPWDGARLMLAAWREGRLDTPRHLAGDERTPIFQPAFSPDGRYLAYLAQDEEWDTLYLHDLERGTIRPLLGDRCLMLPAWVQGLRTFAWLNPERLLVLENRAGFSRILLVGLDGSVQEYDPAPYTWLRQPAAAPQGDRVAFLASSPLIPERVVVWHLADQRWETHARSAPEDIPAAYLPTPEDITWKAPDGLTVHALYYAPVPAERRSETPPPAIVSVHGGPTSQRTSAFNAQAAYFASRGYAYIELNYRGSTGYGRRYREALYGRWGEVDVEDAVGLARILAERGLADPRRLVILGGSAGGYTVLNTLARHPGLYRAGVDLYGVSDLFALDLDTHKFERHYTAKLVGTLPEAAEKYRTWSPLFHAERIRDPLAVFQGGKDKVVPPDQSERIVQTLRRRGVPHIYKVYPEEGHGFRLPETLEDYYATLERFLLVHVIFA